MPRKLLLEPIHLIVHYENGNRNWTSEIRT